MVANTSPPKDDVGQVKPGDASCARSGAPGVRAEGCRQLEDAYESRVEAILEAMADGHSLREVADICACRTPLSPKPSTGCSSASAAPLGPQNDENAPPDIRCGAPLSVSSVTRPRLAAR